MDKTKVFPHLALFAVALIYGANYLIAKNVMNDGYLQPFAFIVLRVVFGAVLLSAFHHFYIKEKIDKKDIPYLALCALTGVAVNMLAFFKGLEITSTVHASIIMTVSPIFVLLASYLILHEKLTTKKIIGVILGFLGALWLVMSTQKTADVVSSLEGDLLILVNALFYSTYLVLVRRLKGKYNTITVVKWAFILAVPLVLPFGFTQLGTTDWSSFTPMIWLAVAYVLFATTFLAYILNAYALGKVNASTVGIYIYLQPIIASVFAVLFSDELFGWVHFVCAILIFSGVYFVSSKNKSAGIKA